MQMDEEFFMEPQGFTCYFFLNIILSNNFVTEKRSIEKHFFKLTSNP